METKTFTKQDDLFFFFFRLFRLLQIKFNIDFKKCSEIFHKYKVYGLYGEVGSDFADETAIKLLLPNKLCNQICFKTAKSINCLKFLESKVININKC